MLSHWTHPLSGPLASANSTVSVELLRPSVVDQHRLGVHSNLQGGLLNQESTLFLFGRSQDHQVYKAYPPLGNLKDPYPLSLGLTTNMSLIRRAVRGEVCMRAVGCRYVEGTLKRGSSLDE